MKIGIIGEVLQSRWIVLNNKMICQFNCHCIQDLTNKHAVALNLIGTDCSNVLPVNANREHFRMM